MFSLANSAFISVNYRVDVTDLAKRSCGLLRGHSDLIMGLNQSFPIGWNVETASDKGITLICPEEVLTSQDGKSWLTRPKA